MRIPLVLTILLLLTSALFAGSTQTNTSGSNTAIEGGYTSSATYEHNKNANATFTYRSLKITIPQIYSKDSLSFPLFFGSFFSSSFFIFIFASSKS